MSMTNTKAQTAGRIRIQITPEMLAAKLEAAKYEAVHAKSKSARAFYTAEVARVSNMLAEARHG